VTDAAAEPSEGGAPAADAPAPAPSVEPEAKKPIVGGPGAARAEVARMAPIVARLELEVASLQGTVARQAQQLADLNSQIARLAAAVGRGDLLTPSATVEQIKAAHAQGKQLLVLKTCHQTGSNGVHFIASTRIEPRQFHLDRIIELVDSGEVAFALVA
jgi:hypothetical protein